MKYIILCAVLVLAGAAPAFSQNLAEVRQDVADLAEAYDAKKADAAAMYLNYVQRDCKVIAEDLANFDLYLPALKSPQAIKAARNYMLVKQQNCAEKLALLKLIKD